MAHQIDFHIDQEIATAMADPKLIPVDVDVDVLDICFFLSYLRLYRSTQDHAYYETKK